MAHALDFEDTHDATLVHPNAAVLPAALAVAEMTGASGRELLTAVALGADLTCRIAGAFAGNPQERGGFLVLPLIGVFGATAAAARLLGLGPERTVQAFSLAFGQAVGSTDANAYGASDFRAVRDAFTAKAAVTAALLAARGVNGFDRPLEGPAGYFALFAGGRYDAAPLLDGLGTRFAATEASFKPWPCCRGAHAFVEAALGLAEENAVAAPAVAGIHVRVSPFFAGLCEPAELRTRPPSAIAAKFSIPFTVGTALARGNVGLADFDAAARAAPDVLALAAKVTHQVCPNWGLAESTRGAVELRLGDGRRVGREVVHPRGHPANPMSPAELRAKFIACGAFAARPAGAARLAEVADLIGRLETLPTVAGLAV
jgi:2-methylcitrate dehydratase PrpD